VGETTGGTNTWGAWFEKTVDYETCRLRGHVREVMLRPVKVPKPDEAKEEEATRLRRTAK